MKLKLLISFFNQGLLSGFNLILSITLIKLLDFSEFGAYSLVFAYGLTLISFQNAVSTTPMSILTKKRVAKGLSKYQGFYNLTQLVFLLVTLLTTFIFCLATSENWLVVSCYALGFCIREYFKSQLLLEFRVKVVLLMDVTFVVLTSISLVLIEVAGYLNKDYAILSLGISSTVSLLLVYKDIDISLNLDKKTLVLWHRFMKFKILKMIKWTVFGVVLTEIHSRSYLYITKFSFGQELLGIIQGVRVIFGPLNLIMAGWFRIGRNYLAGTLGRKDNKKFSSFIYISVSAFIAINFSLFVIVSFFWDTITKFLFSSIDVDLYNSMACWAITVATIHIRTIVSTALQAYCVFKQQTIYNFCGGTVTLVSALLIVSYLNWTLIPLSLFLGEVVLLFLSLIHLIRLKTKTTLT